MLYRAAATRLAALFLRSEFARRAAQRLATARGRSLVLLYHRVLPDRALPRAIVPAVSSSVFRQHLQVLSNIGQIVPLAQLLQPAGPHESPRFSITFDDDCAGHVDTVLPQLEALRIPATFFLSGRALHALPHYWWTIVEHSIHSHGLERTSQVLGLAARTPADLAMALERSPLSHDVVNRLPIPDEAQLTATGIRSLARAGMTIGFHTLHHPLLTLLDDQGLEVAMSAGRRELADAVGCDVDLLAYPHGRATSRVAGAAERAGYSAAFIADGRPVVRWSDRFLLARWEPGSLSSEEMSSAVLIRLLRAPTPSRTKRACATGRNSRSRYIVADT